MLQPDCAHARLVLFLAPVLLAAGQGPQGEGPLDNDVFLPTSERAAQALAQGDQALGQDPDQRVAALDAWRRALDESQSGDCAPAPRGVEAVELAVARRLKSAGAEVCGAWRARFESAAAAAAAGAGSEPSMLSRVERGFPLTRSASRSSLALCDLALESGDPLAAATWLERARGHADPADGEIAAAIERRASALRPSGLQKEASAWQAASHLEIEDRVALTASEAAPEAPSGPARRGVPPGIALLSRGRACVQSADSLHLVGATEGERAKGEHAKSEHGRAQSLPLPALGREFGWNWLPPFAQKGETWPLLPASSGSDGDRIALVAGRAGGSRGNALLLVDAGSGSQSTPPPDAPHPAETPHLAWGYSDAGFHGDEAGARSLGDLLGPGLWEFEPGPVILGETVLVQARQWTAEGDEKPAVDERSVRAWCLALDLASGLPRWKRMLAIGASGKARLTGARGFARPAEPLSSADGRVFAGTGIGAGALIDACDGRILATVKCRRAPEEALAWGPSAPIFVRPFGPRDESSIVWAPSGSDRLYFLRVDEAGIASAPFVLPPREIGGDREPIAAERERILLLSDRGDRATLSRVSPITGARADSVPIPLGETFAGGGRVSPARAIVASDRAVYLFDLSRDLYMLDSIRLPGREESPEGGIAARGDRVFVAGERSLWILRAR